MEFHSFPNFYLLLSFSIIFFSSSFSHANAKVPFKICDKNEHYAVKVSKIEISPTPIVSGIPATFKISASTGKTISGGEVEVEASYFGTPAHTETIDLCKIVSCPVASGKFLLSHTQTFPLTTAPGPYDVKLTIRDDANELLSCIKFNIQIDLGSVTADI